MSSRLIAFILIPTIIYIFKTKSIENKIVFPSNSQAARIPWECGISRGARKVTRTPKVIKEKKIVFPSNRPSFISFIYYFFNDYNIYIFKTENIEIKLFFPSIRPSFIMFIFKFFIRTIIYIFKTENIEN